MRQPSWTRNRERNPLTGLLRKKARRHEQRKRRSAVSLEKLMSVTAKKWLIALATILSSICPIYANLLTNFRLHRSLHSLTYLKRVMLLMTRIRLVMDEVVDLESKVMDIHPNDEENYGGFIKP